MSPKTEKQLNTLVDRLQADLDAAESRANEAEQELENIKEQLADGRSTWAQPRPWEVKDLPVPRLEMHWCNLDENDGYDVQCIYVLVYRHLLDGATDQKVIANPMGMTRSSGREYGFINKHADRINTPFRDGAHAMSDAFQLKLPLYITTPDGDVDQIVFAVGATDHHACTHVQVRRVKHDG